MSWYAFICNKKNNKKQAWYWPNIWSVLFPTIFSASWAGVGPKHSNSVPFSAGIAVPLSVDEKDVAFVPNPVPVVTVKSLLFPFPHERSLGVVCGKTQSHCAETHSLLAPPTLQMVTPLMSPVTVHLKVKVSLLQVGGAARNCPSPGENCSYKTKNCNWFLIAYTYYTFPWMIVCL